MEFEQSRQSSIQELTFNGGADSLGELSTPVEIEGLESRKV